VIETKREQYRRRSTCCILGADGHAAVLPSAESGPRRSSAENQTSGVLLKHRKINLLDTEQSVYGTGDRWL
jgi:hypothetical protein